MSRLVLTRIDLSSDKFIPRDLLKSWMTTGSRYAHALVQLCVALCLLLGDLDVTVIMSYDSASSPHTLTFCIPDEPMIGSRPLLSSPRSHLRLFAVNLVRSVLRSGSASERVRNPALAAHTGMTATTDEARSEEWCIETLVAQLNGDEPAVSRAALAVLEEATQDERCLRTLVSRDFFLQQIRVTPCSGCGFLPLTRGMHCQRITVPRSPYRTMLPVQASSQRAA